MSKTYITRTRKLRNGARMTTRMSTGEYLTGGCLTSIVMFFPRLIMNSMGLILRVCKFFLITWWLAPLKWLFGKKK